MLFTPTHHYWTNTIALWDGQHSILICFLAAYNPFMSPMCTSHYQWPIIHIYPMQSKTDAGEALTHVVKDIGIPATIVLT